VAATKPQSPPHLRAYLAMLPSNRRKTTGEIAEGIGMNREALAARLRGELWISLTEAQLLCRYLEESYATLFPGNSGIDPQDIETVRIALEVGAA